MQETSCWLKTTGYADVSERKRERKEKKRERKKRGRKKFRALKKQAHRFNLFTVIIYFYMYVCMYIIFFFYLPFHPFFFFFFLPLCVTVPRAKGWYRQLVRGVRRGFARMNADRLRGHDRLFERLINPLTSWQLHPVRYDMKKQIRKRNVEKN